MDNLNLDRIFKEDAERKRKKHGEYKEITFREYLELLERDALIAQNSPARLLEVATHSGTTEIPPEDRMLYAGREEIRRYNLFSDKLFGLERPVFQVVKYFEAGANHLSTGKQLLLLVGPTASGKSTFVSILKHALEDYCVRPVYVIKDCPMFGEPLHLLPRHLRKEFENRLNLRISGDLCPPCRYMLKSKFTREDGSIEWWNVPVTTFSFSIQGTRGIGSFEPSDERSQDVTELVGRENISISSAHGPDHPYAYSLTGEFEKANRGICEWREMIKSNEKLLWVGISLAEEQEIKVQGSSFPHISVDTVVIGHTNLTEFAKFSASQDNEALHDRIYVVPFPYPLRVQDEVKIYRKLIERESDFDSLKCHIAPGSLELAALFAVLTRLTSSKMGIAPLVKAKIYNGEKTLTELRDKDKAPIDIRALVEEGQSASDLGKREGMFGVSSRDVLSAINTELVRQSEKCLTPLSVIRALRGVFEHRMGYPAEDINRYRELLSAGEGGSVMNEFKDYVTRSVTRAFLSAYSDLARELFYRYVMEVEFYRNQKWKFVRGQMDIRRDDLSGKVKEADVKFLASVEQHMGIGAREADVFRGEILEFKASNPMSFGFDTYPPLARAVEEKLLIESRSSLALVLARDKPKDEEAKQRAKDLFQGLSESGFCEICAREMIEKASEFLSG